MLRILLLLLIIVVGVVGYRTNPKVEAYVEPAREAIGNVGEEQLNSGDVIGAVTSGAQSVGIGGQGEYTNYYVASSYSLPNAQNPTVTCYGAFTKVWTCQRVNGGGEPPASGG
ncbi:hypothetical protein [Terricaulis sp.]|uniref:hypothetical protein n=1 Tax=Terricaulis sp. TaxID=2768686 RepID=UPI00378450FD